jgi:biotin-(acetyl-CoA carboxylase) ligase
VIEAGDGAVVLGIRLAVNHTRAELPDEVPPAASLLTIGARRHERAPLLADLLLRLEGAYDSWSADGLDGIYVGLGSRDFLRGRKVSVDGKTGVAVAVDREGRLEVDVGGERRLLESGGVTYDR